MTVDRKKLDAAVDEAKRFIARAKALPKPRPYDCNGYRLMRDYFPKEQGAIRRASMDLTRALADLRRPN